jgi:hypothetical protein
MPSHMPQWEAELRALLMALGVTLDDSSPEGSSLALLEIEEPSDASMRAQEEQPADSDDGEDQFAVVNREMEATVREVARLVRSGYIDKHLRDDVMRVLSALTRSVPCGVSDEQDWQLTTAAAVLHFCRIVLRLARALSSQID